ncbi:MAG: hypothetical protein KY468_00210 [Armatimonadetes bacterium]|nr:hypothetical protein [Armatimonadota bacterium]
MEQIRLSTLRPEDLVQYGAALDEILLQIKQIDIRIREHQAEIRRMKGKMYAPSRQ